VHLTYAQEDTTAVDSASVFLDKPVYTETTTDDGNNLFTAVDTSLNGLQKYHPGRAGVFPSAFLSNTGAAYQLRWFSFNASPGLLIGRNELDPYLYDPDSLRFYRTTAPFTDLYYVLGQFNEQLFHLRHTQNFGKDMNVAVDLNKYLSQGFYQNERKAGTNLAITSWWQSPEQRYRVYGAFLWSKIQNEENGGLQPDTLYTTYLGPPELAETFLDNALTDRGYLHGRITQTYDFGNTTYTYDTLVTDSVVGKSFVPKLRLYNQTGFFNQRYDFYDASTDRSFYGDGIPSVDTLKAISDVDGWFSKLDLMSVNSMDSFNRLFFWKAGLHYTDAEWADTTGTYDKSVLLAKAQVGMIWVNDRRPSISLNAQKDLLSDAYYTGLSFATGRDLLRFHGEVFLGVRNHTWVFSQYTDFQSTWDATQIMFSRGFSASIESKTYDLMLRYKTVAIEDYRYLVYYDGSEGGDPGIYLGLTFGASRVHQLELRKNFSFGNFHMNNHLGWQRATEAVIHLPEFLVDISWYYEASLFKSALQMQAGIDTWWVSDYAADAFDPVSGQFYYQSTDTLSFYPVTDAFVNFDIKSFRFFVKGVNLTQGLFAKGYFEAPDYPMPPRSVRFGLRWYIFY